MKINIAYPRNGTNITIKADMYAVQRLTGKKILDTFNGSDISPEYEGHIFQINGGCDKQGFPMNAKFITDRRRSPLLRKGDLGYRCKTKGIRMRKTCRGSIVSSEIAMLNVSLTEAHPEKQIEGLINKINPPALLPKRYKKLLKRFDIKDKPSVEVLTQYIQDLYESQGAADQCPKIKVVGYETEEKKKAKDDMKRISAERKQKSQQAAAEFKKRYPNFGNIKV